MEELIPSLYFVFAVIAVIGYYYYYYYYMNH